MTTAIVMATRCRFDHLRQKARAFSINVRLVKNWLGLTAMMMHRSRPPRYLLALRNGLRFIIRPYVSDLAVLREVYHYGVYTKMAMLERVFHGASLVVVDVGAYIGDYSLLMALMYPNAKVCAFEPNPDSYALLRQNIEMNAGVIDPSRITTRCVAVAGHSGQRTLDCSLLYPQNAGLAGLYPHGESDRIQVQAEPLSSLVAGPIDILKMDCEGAEYEILEGLVATGKIKEVSSVVMEWHKIPGRPVEALMRFLEGEGFDVLHGEPPSKDDGVGIIYAVRKGLANPGESRGLGGVRE